MNVGKLETTLIKLSVLVLLSFVGVGKADAAGKTWVGSASGNSNNWNTASNWNPAGVPGTGDDVTIPGAKINHPILTAAASNTVHTIAINSGGVLTIGSGGALETTKGSASVTVNGTLTMSGGTLIAFQDISGSGTVSMSGGTLQVGHDFRIDPTSFSATGGTVEWTGEVGSAGAGAFPGTSAYQFFNVLVDAGVDPGFDNKANSFLITGNWINNGSAKLTGKATTVTFNGATPQVIGGSSSNTFVNLTINNGTGITLGATATVNGTLTLTSGVVATGTNRMVLPVGGTLVGGSSASYINGNFQKAFSTGAGQSFTFPIGDGSNYAPVNLASVNITTAGSLTAKSTAGDHPSIAGSGISSTRGVNRYWTLANNPAGIVVGSYNATFNFASGDVDAGANVSNFIAARYSGGWSNVTIASRTSTSITVNGLAAYGDFSTGELGGPATFTSCNIQVDGSALLNLTGLSGRTYTMQASTDLISWTNIGQATADTNGVFQFIDVNAPSFAHRYYRASYP